MASRRGALTDEFSAYADILASTLTFSEEEAGKARLAVCAQAESVEEARMLLTMMGLT